MKDVRPRTLDPEPSAGRLGHRAFSTGEVDSLGEGFVLKKISDIYSLDIKTNKEIS